MHIQIFQETVDGIDMKIPCAVNIKDVNDDDEIVVYKLAHTKVGPKAKSVAAVLEPPVKKLKAA